MKKLIVMLATAAAAIGLYATDVINENFGDTPVATPTALSTNETGWAFSGAEYANQAMITAHEVEGDRGPNYLSMNTLPGTLSRTIPSASQAVEGAMYFDSYVKFTEPSEDAPLASAYADGKLALFTLTNETEIGLYVIGAYGSDISTNRAFKLGTLTSEFFSDFHRVTIKIYENVLPTTGEYQGVRPGFCVYIDGTLRVATEAYILENGVMTKDTAWSQDEHYLGDPVLVDSVISRVMDRSLILSLKGGVGSSSFSAFDFQGKGSLDNIVYTTTKPDFVLVDSSMITVTKGDGVSSIQYAINDGAAQTLTGSTILFTDGDSVTISATYASGYSYKAGKWTVNDNTVDGSSGSYTWEPGNLDAVEISGYRALVKVGEDEYEDIDDAMEAINNAAAGTVLKLMNDITLDSETITAQFLEFANADGVVLDLAGKSITGTDSSMGTVSVLEGGILTIIDTVGGGVVNKSYNGEEYGDSVQNTDSTLTISNGCFAGAVSTIKDGEEATPATAIEGGKFKVKVTGEYVTLAEGRTWSAEPDAQGYYTLVDAGPDTVTLTIPELNNVTVSATTNGQVVASGAGAFVVLKDAEVNVAWSTANPYVFVADETQSSNEVVVADADKTLTVPAVRELVAATGVALSIAEATLDVGDITNITQTVVPSNADVDNESWFWWSTDESVATVLDGAVEAVAAGNAKIWARVTDKLGNIVSNFCAITVAAAVEPIAPGQTAEVDKSKTKAEAEAMVTPSVPATIAADIENAHLTETYKSYFESVATRASDSDNWTVKVVMKSAISNEVQTAVNDMGSAILTTVASPTETKATLTTKPGLYYGIVQKSAVGEMGSASPDSWELATGTSLEFDIDKTGDIKFYKTMCSETGGTSNK